MAADHADPRPHRVRLRGRAGQPFDDLGDAGARSLVGIRRIVVWADADVRGLRFIYGRANDKKWRAPVRGSKTGKRTAIDLADDEVVLQVSAYGDGLRVRQLTFVTARPDGTAKVYGPFGSGLPIQPSGNKVKSMPYRNWSLGGTFDDGFTFFGLRVEALCGQATSERVTGLGWYTTPLMKSPDGATVTTVLAEDYRRVSKRLVPRPVYRATIGLPEGTSTVDLWAAEQVRVIVRGRRHVLDPEKPTTVDVDELARLVLTIEAKGLALPALKVRPDGATGAWSWITVNPELAAHEKVAALRPDALYANRKKLGVDRKATKADCRAVQAAMTELAKTSLPSRREPTNERTVSTDNMSASNWVLDLSKKKNAFEPVSNAAAKKLKKSLASATRVKSASGLGDLAKKGAGAVGKVVVETKKKKPVRKTAKKAAKKTGVDKVAKNTVKVAVTAGSTVVNVADELKDGDIVGAGSDLVSGGRKLGRDVKTLGESVVVTIVTVGGEVVEFVLDNAMKVGGLLVELLQTIGAKIMEFIEMLMDLLPWKAIAKTQKALAKNLERLLDDLITADTEPIARALHAAFETARSEGTSAIDALIKKLGGKTKSKSKVMNGQLVDGAKKLMSLLDKPMEWIGWLLDKLFEQLPDPAGWRKLLAPATKAMERVMKALLDAVADCADEIPATLREAFANLEAALKSPQDAISLITCALLQLVQGVFIVGVTVAEAVVSALLEALRGLVEVFVSLLKVKPLKRKKRVGDLPSLSDLLGPFVDTDLTLLDVVTFGLAIPVTLVSLAATGRAPKLGARGARGLSLTDDGALWAFAVLGELRVSIGGSLDFRTIAQTKVEKVTAELFDTPPAEFTTPGFRLLELAALVTRAVILSLAGFRIGGKQGVRWAAWAWDLLLLFLDFGSWCWRKARLMRTNWSLGGVRGGAVVTAAFATVAIVLKSVALAVEDDPAPGPAFGYVAGPVGTLGSTVVLAACAEKSTTGAKVVAGWDIGLGTCASIAKVLEF
ncbi:MAG: hypothetical protein RIT81_00735 [Deltaproteobacteria bacterium]